MRIAIGAVALICGFSLSGEARPRPPALQAQGIDTCGWIGVSVSPMTSAFANSLGMTEPYGAIFDQPEAGSPAARAGIQAGDVVTSIDGMPILRSADLAPMISAMSPETIVHLATYRDGQMIEVQLMLGTGKCPSAQHGGVLIPVRFS